MALVDEAGFVCNQSQGVIGASDQGLCPLKALLDEVTLWPDPHRLLEGATKMVNAEAGDRSKLGQRQVPIEVCFDVVTDTL